MRRTATGGGISAAALLAAGALALAGGCAGPALRPAHFAFFATPDADDAWTPLIASWQARERALPELEKLRPPAPVSGAGGAAVAAGERPDLRAAYFAFRSERKREIAREVASWIQDAARRHYVPDGPIDHWATLEETLARNGDDCDGLELLPYHLLRDLGFREDEVFRAIVFRASDDQHHMVTLWFESPDDPWVIDPTGAMTSGMPRLSEVRGWAPVKVFSETREYTARVVRGDFAQNAIPIPAR